MRLELTRRGDYAVRAMRVLARRPDVTDAGSRLQSVTRIAEVAAIPPRILPSVMTLLRRAGLVDAEEGRTGGYRLARPAERISLLEVIEAIEGDTRRRTCALRGGRCLADGPCEIHETLWRAQEAYRNALAATMLAHDGDSDRSAAATASDISVRQPPNPAHRAGDRP